MFQIGIRTKPKSNKKQKRQTGYTIQRIPTIDLEFEPYSGERWVLPAGFTCSRSVQYKFSQFETLPINTVLYRLINEVKGFKLFSNVIFSAKSWIPSQNIILAIQAYNDTQRNEFKKVKTMYLQIFKLLGILKRLLHRWCINKCIRNVKNTEDPVTLELPKKPVRVIDFKKRISYVYDASSLRRVIENRLLYSDYMFPEAKEPINLLSNEPFTYGQLLSILSQCKIHGEFSWVLDRFKDSHCTLSIFKKKFKQMLKIESIKSHFKIHRDARESVIDYFESYAQVSLMPDSQIDKFSSMYSQAGNLHPYILKWIAITREYYIAAELHELTDLLQIARDTHSLLQLGLSIL